jgi:hypothetical protein
VNFTHWVSLHASPIDCDFDGELGRDERTKPRIKIAYEASLKSEEKKKRKKKTKETTSHESDEDDSANPLRVWKETMITDERNSKMKKTKEDFGRVQMEMEVDEEVVSPNTRDRNERARKERLRTSSEKKPKKQKSLVTVSHHNQREKEEKKEEVNPEFKLTMEKKTKQLIDEVN